MIRDGIVYMGRKEKPPWAASSISIRTKIIAIMHHDGFLITVQVGAVWAFLRGSMRRKRLNPAGLTCTYG